MDGEAHPGDPLERGVEETGEVGPCLGVDGRRRLVELDEVDARRGHGAQLGVEDGHEGPGRGKAIRVDLARPAGQAAGERERPGDGHLEGLRGPRTGIRVLRHDAKPGRRGDRLEDLEAVLLVVARRAHQATLAAAAATPVRWP